MKVTNRDIKLAPAWTGVRITIPKGTPVIPATNLPEKDKYWIQWDGRATGNQPTEVIQSWIEQGFSVKAEDVE